MKNKTFKKSLSVFLAVLMLMSCWVWVAPEKAKAASAVSYPLSIKVNNETKLTNGGNIQVYYYEVNSDGSLNTSSLLKYNFVNSLTRDKGAQPTYSDTIPGFPVKIAVNVANYTWGTDKMGVKVITIGNKTIFNDNWTVLDDQTINWEKGVTLGSWNPNGVWENPSWSNSSTIGGTSVQVPTSGSKTVSLSQKASWEDQYGVAWPQSNVSYSVSGNGVSVSQSSGTLTGVTVNSSVLTKFGASKTKECHCYCYGKRYQ